MDSKGMKQRVLSSEFIREQEIKIKEEIDSYLDFQKVRQAFSDNGGGAKDGDPIYLTYMLDRQRKLLPQLKKALTLIEEGEYGTCQRCGGEIEIERLKFVPSAMVCCSCIKKYKL